MQWLLGGSIKLPAIKKTVILSIYNQYYLYNGLTFQKNIYLCITKHENRYTLCR